MWLRAALSTGLLVAAFAIPQLPQSPLGSQTAPLGLSVTSHDDLEEAALAEHVAHAEALLSELGLDGVITSRRKSPYSTWMKMQNKGLSRDQVLDRLALRVRVETEQDCYDMLNALHSANDFRDECVKDYIATPKANGYASIHTVLNTAMGPVEVQIRTHAMHDYNETGPASHTAYKVSNGFSAAA